MTEFAPGSFADVFPSLVPAVVMWAHVKTDMTIYRLYSQNGDRAGFWVQHRSWANLCARVQSIAGKDFGKLPGQPPLHDSAPISLQCFDVRSGRPSSSQVLEADLN